ncbi:NapC/NirT family cytochrome c [Cereibacter sphaeroides]|uniref:NapC/NirT family cytochrome c n=1 Tax=Cereibacter sphaeroides TaxID=1063 RepID=UPI003990DBF7
MELLLSKTSWAASCSGRVQPAFETTNKGSYCTSWRAMRSNAFEESTLAVHYTHRSGARVGCPACEFPHEWTDRIARKMQASKYVWRHLLGPIDTFRRFLDNRLRPAEHEEARAKAKEPLECRNVHSEGAMDFPARRTARRRSSRTI